ncbi:MAG: 2-C-methyl-D-erythritol 4-phosphate cytidylyltransferase [Selenomonadaceae bacterium]|nr:2-C-methyl-D-erythritol 4-phosphate cytidylyltransferase [Selenomonadaceae bacterium]
MVSVIFPAAGQGRRMKVGKNKVFLELKGLPILVRTLLRFSQLQEVGQLILAVGPSEIRDVEEMLEGVSGLKPCSIVAGGSERQYSIANCIKLVAMDADIVLVHDAARPLVSVETIKGVIDKARNVGGAIAAVPEKNTVKVVSKDGMVVSTPPRESLWAVQTPQGFQRDILLRAYAKAEEDGYLGTDDASLVERLGVPVQVVASDYRNIKITTPEDLVIAEALL